MEGRQVPHPAAASLPSGSPVPNFIGLGSREAWPCSGQQGSVGERMRVLFPGEGRFLLDLPSQLKQAFIEATDARVLLLLQPVGSWGHRHRTCSWDLPSLAIWFSALCGEGRRRSF